MHRGRAILLCIYLIGWLPLRYATMLFETLPTLGMRGAAAAIELAVHGVITAVGAAAGWMVWTGTPAARGFARIAVLASGAVTIAGLFWTALPSQVAPGARWPLAALAALYTLFWLAVIGRDRRSA